MDFRSAWNYAVVWLTITLGGLLAATVAPGSIIQDRGDVVVVDDFMGVQINFDDLEAFTVTLSYLKKDLNRISNNLLEGGKTCNNGLQPYLENILEELSNDLKPISLDELSAKRNKRGIAPFVIGGIASLYGLSTQVSTNLFAEKYILSAGTAERIKCKGSKVTK